MNRTMAGVIVGAFTLAAFASLGTTPASADPANPGYTFNRTPSHGKPGTVIHVEGTGCQYEGKPYDYAKLYLYRKGEGHLPPRAEGKYDIADDGSFSGEITVPADAPAGPYGLSADCHAADMVFPVADSDFTVDGASPSPTPSRTPTRSPSPRPTPSRTPTPRPRVTHTPSPRPTPLRTTARALPSPTPVLASPSPSAVASSHPADQADVPAALAVAAATLIGVNGLGLRAVGRHR